MSKAVDRNKVFQTTRVRTSLKNDASWIQKSGEEKKEQDDSRTEQAVETRHLLVSKSSYVLSTIKKFEFQAEHVPEEHTQNDEAESEKSVDNTSEGDKDEYADPTVDQSNVEHNQMAVEEHIPNGEAQPVSSTKEKPEAESPVDTAEPPVATSTAENKEKYTDPAADQFHIEHSEVKVSADAHAEDPIADTSATTDTEASKDNAEVSAVTVRVQEETSAETEPANATNLEDAKADSAVHPAEVSHEDCLSEQASKEIVEAVAEVVAESSPDKSDVINATPGEVALQDSVEAVPDLLAKFVCELPTQSAAETATEASCEKDPPEEAARETVEVVAQVNVESSPETPPVTETAGEQDNVEPVPDLVADTVSESPTQPSAETAVKSVEREVESAASAEPALQTSAEELVECKVQPADDTVVELSVKPTPEDTAERVVELNVKDAVEPAKVTDAEAVQNTTANRIIELSDALDVEPSTSEPLKDQEQSHTEETNLNQHSDHANSSETSQKPEEEVQSIQTLKDTRDNKNVCAFCDKTIDGNVKIKLSEPLMNCHPDCLKCGVCAKALGDLLTPMFLHNQEILCGGCFAKTQT
uniref:retinitis pigmentosa 1-like 1 protein n=1 Tax=Scatophagus argus TaxID=75038 RepID=UPI001ED81695|nr:retinitis pigmentosa 1-like 1 protein [Scatophagus argus]